MKNYHIEKTETITASERENLIASLLTSDTNRGRLHQPNEAYFNQLIGLNQFAMDVYAWLGHHSTPIDVVATMDSTWHAADTKDVKNIYIPEVIINKQPFLALYFTCLGACSFLVDERMVNKSFSHAARQGLLEHLSIEAGFGIYGLNAVYDTDSSTKRDTDRQVLNFLTVEHYKELFVAYCMRNTISFTSYEQALLPSAQDTLRLHSPEGKRKSFVRRYLRKKKSIKERFALSILSAIFLVSFLYMLWPFIPKTLSQEQRTIQSEIILLKQQYNDCQKVLSQMHESIIAPDVLSSRSLQQQSLACSELKQEHDQLVHRFNRSL
jgi:hypothetical protein